MIDVKLVIVVGLALASLWFWMAVLLRITDTSRGFWSWVKVFVPQGIIISWALYLLLSRFEIM